MFKCCCVLCTKVWHTHRKITSAAKIVSDIVCAVKLPILSHMTQKIGINKSSIKLKITQHFLNKSLHADIEKGGGGNTF